MVVFVSLEPDLVEELLAVEVHAVTDHVGDFQTRTTARTPVLLVLREIIFDLIDFFLGYLFDSAGDVGV